MKEDETGFDPDVIEACRHLFDAYFDDACDRFGSAVLDILARANVRGTRSAADLCKRIGLEVAWSDNGSLLMLTPAVKPAFLQGEPIACSEGLAPVQQGEWNRQIPFVD